MIAGPPETNPWTRTCIFGSAVSCPSLRHRKAARAPLILTSATPPGLFPFRPRRGSRRATCGWSRTSDLRPRDPMYWFTKRRNWPATSPSRADHCQAVCFHRTDSDFVVKIIDVTLATLRQRSQPGGLDGPFPNAVIGRGFPRSTARAFPAGFCP
jgi:hypothetical protein